MIKRKEESCREPKIGREGGIPASGSAAAFPKQEHQQLVCSLSKMTTDSAKRKRERRAEQLLDGGTERHPGPLPAPQGSDEQV